MYHPHLLLLNVLKIQGTFPSCSCICICLLWGHELRLAGVIRNSLSRPLPWQPHHSRHARMLGTACAAAGGGCRAALGKGAAAARPVSEQQPGRLAAGRSTEAAARCRPEGLGTGVGCPLSRAHPALGCAMRHRRAVTASGAPTRCMFMCSCT